MSSDNHSCDSVFQGGAAKNAEACLLGRLAPSALSRVGRPWDSVFQGDAVKDWEACVVGRIEMATTLLGAGHSGDSVFQSAVAKKGETRVLGRVEMGYHWHWPPCHLGDQAMGANKEHR